MYFLFNLLVNWCVVTFMPILKHIKKTRAFHFRWIPVKLNAGVSSQDERVFFSVVNVL